MKLPEFPVQACRPPSGLLRVVLMVRTPPLLPVPVSQFQTVSETYEPPGPVVVRVVPPTCVMFVLSAGNGTAPVNRIEISGSVEEGLSLRRHLLEDLLGRCVARTAAPRTTELLGEIVIRHAAQ